MTISALFNRGLLSVGAGVLGIAISTHTATGRQTATQSQTATQQKPYQPSVGQAGKDVVWVPTADTLVAKMLDMAKVTPQDYVIDLGSGDGRTVIAAAKRGATALGIEYNPDMVELSKKNAQTAGVSAKATFMKADIFESDFSKATVITLFLLPQLNVRLRPILLDMKPGTRVVSNSFDMDDWLPDDTAHVEQECTSWCTAFLWIIPAKVEGTWRLGQKDLTLTQKYQVLTGTLGTDPLYEGKMHGTQITFKAGGTNYAGSVNGSSMTGSGWSASRK